MGFGGEIDVVVAEGPFTDSVILVGFVYDRVTGSYNNHINVGPGTSGPSNGNFTQQVFALNLKIEKFVTERIVFGGGVGAVLIDTKVSGSFNASGTVVGGSGRLFVDFYVAPNLSIGPEATIVTPFGRALSGGGGGIDALSVRTFGARKMRLGIKYTF